MADSEMQFIKLKWVIGWLIGVKDGQLDFISSYCAIAQVAWQRQAVPYIIFPQNWYMPVGVSLNGLCMCWFTRGNPFMQYCVAVCSEVTIVRSFPSTANVPFIRGTFQWSHMLTFSAPILRLEWAVLGPAWSSNIPGAGVSTFSLCFYSGLLPFLMVQIPSKPLEAVNLALYPPWKVPLVMWCGQYHSKTHQHDRQCTATHQ